MNANAPEKHQGERLKAARIKAGFESAAAFARELDLSNQRYGQYERGTRGLSRDAKLVLKMAQRLNVSVNWLIYGEEKHIVAGQEPAILGEIMLAIMSALAQTDRPTPPAEALGQLVLAVSDQLNDADIDDDTSPAARKKLITTLTRSVLKGFQLARTSA